MKLRPPESAGFTHVHRLTGFTLVEVMISIAIALVLIIGVSQIFGIAQQTTGQANALLTAADTSRSVQSILTNDFRTIDNAKGDSPGLVLVSVSEGVFRDATDMRQNRAIDAVTGRPDPLQMNDPASSGSLPPFSLGLVNSRVHRYDKLCFWTRDRFSRQTADAPNLTSSTVANEAFVWLGHLSLPNNSAIASWTPNTLGNNTPAKWFLPGYPSNGGNNNDNNLFASQGILGREVILLTPDGSLPNNPFLTPRGESVFPGPPTSAGFDPLSLLVPSFTVDITTKNKVLLAQSRFDLAATTIADYRQFIQSYPVHNSHAWWEHLSGTYLTSPKQSSDTRYQGDPFIVKPPAGTTGAAAANWLSPAVAQSYPVFVRGCAHFIVEFAGDFVTQDSDPRSPTYGKVTAAVSDGEVDFAIDPVTNNRKIRWYGFPRDANGDGVIDPLNDVVPLSVILRFYGVPVPAQPWIERMAPWTLPSPSPRSGNLPDFLSRRDAVPFTPAGMANPPVSVPYICAWGPQTDAQSIPRPRMIRILMAVDDPNGHLNQEQLYEYVYELP